LALSQTHPAADGEAFTNDLASGPILG